MTPALLREASYSTLRMGLYEPIKSYLNAGDSVLLGRYAAGALSGAIGAAIANPTDLVMVTHLPCNPMVTILVMASASPGTNAGQ